MSNRIIEVPEFSSGTDNPPSKTNAYRAIGWTEEATVRSLIRNTTPEMLIASGGLLYRNDIRTRQVAFDIIDAEVLYGDRKVEVGEWSFSFNTTGGTVHISHSKQSIKRYGTTLNEEEEIVQVVEDDETDPVTIPKHHRAIGYDGETVQGADIVIPAIEVNIHYKHPQGVVNLNSFVRHIASLTGLVNSTPFFGWAPGEVLFLGGQGEDGSNREMSVSYSFAISYNTSTLSIGSIADIAKKGWEYVWIRYDDDVSAGDGVKVPKYAYVERVYDTVDLAGALGFG